MKNDLHVSERGTTLVELLMVISISSIIGVLVLQSITTVSHITTRMAEHAQDSSSVKLALDTLSTNFRAATVNPERPDAPQFEIARGGEAKFLTYGYSGFSEPPHWVHYRLKRGVLYQVDPQTGQEHAIYRGIKRYEIFRFYRWDFDHKQHGDRLGNCFKALSNKELDTAEGRKSIVGLQIQLDRLGEDNIREHKKRHAGAWVRIMEQIQPQDPVTGERISDWKNRCWESQVGRIR